MLPGKGKSLVDWQVLKAYFKERPDRVCCSRNFAHEIITNKRRDLGTAWIGFSRDAPIAPSFDLSAARGKQVSSCKCGHWHGSLDKLRTDSRFGRNTAKRKGQNLPWSDCFRMLRLLRANWLRQEILRRFEAVWVVPRISSSIGSRTTRTDAAGATG